jgi:hypothetical protein
MQDGLIIEDRPSARMIPSPEEELVLARGEDR